MKHRNWRELAEAVGFVTVVAVLLMIALEQRSSNRIALRIAETEAQRSLAAMRTSLNMSRATNAEIARTYAKMAAPQGQLITPTDLTQMNAVAQQYINIGRTAQFAHDQGLLPRAELEQLRRELEVAIEDFPGLHAPLVAVYKTVDDAGALYVLEPVAQLAAVEPPAGEN